MIRSGSGAGRLPSTENGSAAPSVGEHLTNALNGEEEAEDR
jgi:hypothetical protein